MQVQKKNTTILQEKNRFQTALNSSYRGEVTVLVVKQFVTGSLFLLVQLFFILIIIIKFPNVSDNSMNACVVNLNTGSVM